MSVKDCVAKLEVGDAVHFSYMDRLFVGMVVGFYEDGIKSKLPILGSNECCTYVVRHEPVSFVYSLRAMMNRSGYKYFGTLEITSPEYRGAISVVKILKC